VATTAAAAAAPSAEASGSTVVILVDVDDVIDDDDDDVDVDESGGPTGLREHDGEDKAVIVCIIPGFSPLHVAVPSSSSHSPLLSSRSFGANGRGVRRPPSWSSGPTSSSSTSTGLEERSSPSKPPSSSSWSSPHERPSGRILSSSTTTVAMAADACTVADYSVLTDEMSEAGLLCRGTRQQRLLIRRRGLDLKRMGDELQRRRDMVEGAALMRLRDYAADGM